MEDIWNSSTLPRAGCMAKLGKCGRWVLVNVTQNRVVTLDKQVYRSSVEMEGNLWKDNLQCGTLILACGRVARWKLFFGERHMKASLKFVYIYLGLSVRL